MMTATGALRKSHGSYLAGASGYNTFMSTTTTQSASS